MNHLQQQVTLTLSQEWGKSIYELPKTVKHAKATAVRTNRGPPVEDILLGDMTESPMSPPFPK